MDRTKQLTEIIKKHVNLRGKDIHKLADLIGVNYKTLYDKLQNNRISVEDLFKISVALDINLEWLKVALGFIQPSAPITPVEILRMSEDYRKSEIPELRRAILRCYEQFPNDLTLVKRELLSTYKELYYVLDVMLPDDYKIFSISERKNTSYYVLSSIRTQQKGLQSPLQKGTDLLNEIIINTLRSK